MKKLLLTLLLIVPLIANAQLTDNFSDGDFTSNPAWSGDVSKWQVNNGQLQSNNNTASDVFYLSTPSTAATNAQWEFFIKLDFSTSSNNYVDIYLISDSANVKGSLNGYFVRMGGTPDEISLYRKDALTITKIIDGVDGRSQSTSSNNLLKIKVKRNITNNWILEDDVTGSGNNYFTEGIVNDGTYTTSNYFGFVITQSTATFFNRHYFDDIYAGPIVQDTIAPLISSLNALTDSLLDVKFSESVDQVTAETTTNYSVNNSIGNPSTATRDVSDLSLVHLVFVSPFVNGTTNIITVNNINDLSANPIVGNTTATFTFYNPQPPMPMDIVINEVLFHPQSGGSEFVELYNASGKVLDLKDVFLYDGSVSNPYYTISASRHIFLPGDYIAITRNVTDIKSRYTILNPNSLLQVASMQTYLDAADTVTIATATGQILDRLVYSESWQFPLLNSFLGVSLERLNAGRATHDQSNWHSAAESVGFATPGYKNSQNDNTTGSGDEISVDPEIFSPDEDGHNDVVNVHYHFSNAGNVANVLVYDAKGRLIRNLVNNELLGNDGSFAWDGVTNANDKARIGMYIFYIEVFDINGDTKNFKKTCVLGGKL